MSLIWIAFLHLGCCNDLLDWSFLSHAADGSIIRVFHPNSQMLCEVAFPFQIKSFISKFLDQVVDTFFVWISHPCIIHAHNDENSGLVKQALVGQTFSESKLQDFLDA